VKDQILVAGQERGYAVISYHTHNNNNNIS